MELSKKKDPLDYIQEKYKTYNAALDEATEAVKSAEDRVTAAKETLEAAADQNDATAFSSAKKQLAEADALLEMATMRKDRIISRGPCQREEVESAIAYYRQQTRDLDLDTAIKLINLYDQIAEIGKSAIIKQSVIRKKYRNLLSITGNEIELVDETASGMLRSINSLNLGIKPLLDPNAAGNAGLLHLRRLAGKVR